MEHLSGLSWTPRATPLTARGLFTAMWDLRKNTKVRISVSRHCYRQQCYCCQNMSNCNLPTISQKNENLPFSKEDPSTVPSSGWRHGADGKMSWRGRLNFTIERAYKITPFCRSLYDLFAIKMQSFLNRKIFNNIVKRF